ncbi:hypothetical protein D9M73_100470 [compost metagenome]
MRDQRAEIEGHVDRRRHAPERPAVEIDHQRAVQFAVLPPVAQRLGRDEHRRKGAGGLGLEEPEALGEFPRNQVAQAHVIGQPDQPHRRQRFLAGGPLRHVARHHHHFALEIAAPAFVRQRDRRARPQKPIGPALIHQRIMPEAVGQLRRARLPHQGDMVHIGRSVRPLVRARQGCRRLMLVEAPHRNHLMFQIGAEILQIGQQPLPIVEGGLQRRRDVRSIGIPGEIVGNHDELAVATRCEAGQFHEALLFRAIIAPPSGVSSATRLTNASPHRTPSKRVADDNCYWRDLT